MGHTPTDQLAKAAWDGQLDEVDRLISAGVDVNGRSGDAWGNALHNAIENGQVEVVRLLLASGADPNAAAGEMLPGWPAIHHALDLELDIWSQKHGREVWHRLTQTLIDAGADVNRTYEGKTVLARARGTPWEPILREAGAHDLG